MSNCAGNCNNNTMILGRPTVNSLKSTQCNSGCGTGSGGSKCAGVGPRKKREEVREEIRTYILNMLGAPNVEIELDEQNIDFCIELALKIIEKYASREFFSYYVFNTSPGKSVYELPADVGYVRNIYYKEMANFAFEAADLGGAIPLEYAFGGSYNSFQGGILDPVQPIWGNMGEWASYKQYEQTFSILSSSIGGWEWLGNYRTIKLYPIPFKVQKVIVHYIQKCKDWEEFSQEMGEGALSYAKEILGRVRGKIRNPPGPGGGVQLDYADLLQEAKEEREKWVENLISKYGDIFGPTWG